MSARPCMTLQVRMISVSSRVKVGVAWTNILTCLIALVAGACGYDMNNNTNDNKNQSNRIEHNAVALLAGFGACACVGLPEIK